MPVVGSAKHGENTLISLSLRCQRNVLATDYEIIVVEGPSDDPLGRARAEACGANLRYFSGSENGAPTLAVFDYAARQSRAPVLGFVDSPCIVTPRFVEHALGALRLATEPLMVVPAYEAVSGDRLSDSDDARALMQPFEHVDWKSNAYELFEFAQFGRANVNGFLCGVQEAELFLCRRTSYEHIRGSEHWIALSTADDLYEQLCQRSECRLVVLGGEGCFRQAPGGHVLVPQRNLWRIDRQPLLYGVLSGHAHDFLRASIANAGMHAALACEHEVEEWPLDLFVEHEPPPSAPLISIVVVIYRIPRQAENVIYSLSANYQRNVRPEDYEIIVVENRSSDMLGEERACRLGSNVRYFARDEPGVSPAPAVNFGASQARGSLLGVMIDGARMSTPRLVEHALLAQRVHPRPIGVAPGYHLGPGMQHITSLRGYDETTEQLLLKNVDWKQSGYRLFEVASFDEATRNGFLNPILEATCVFCTRECFDELGGMDVRFDLPGGGEVNHDFFDRLCRLENTRLVMLWGEGTFHQYHGGVSSDGGQEREARLDAFRRQYDMLRGRRFQTYEREPLLLGTCAGSAHELLAKAAVLGRLRFGMIRAVGRPEWPNG